MTELTFFLNNEDDTIAVGQQLARYIKAPLTLYLTGDLGAGKTTLSRGLIQGLGHQGAVKVLHTHSLNLMNLTVSKFIILICIASTILKNSNLWGSAITFQIRVFA